MSDDEHIKDADDDGWVPPDQAPAADLPAHARERLAEMRAKRFFTSDLTVNEFLLVKEAGFEPLGLVMGSSIYKITPNIPWGAADGELEAMTQALYHSRELAMTRMEEEADALGADGIIAVRLDVKLHEWGKNVAEFLAVGTAIRHRGGESYRNKAGKPFQSDLSGQDFWTLLRSGYRPAGFVMGNCVYYVSAATVRGDGRWSSGESWRHTHALYDARELAMERLQTEAEDLGAEGVVGVTIDLKQHGWGGAIFGKGNAALRNGELIELFVVGTAVVPMKQSLEIPRPTLVIPMER